MKIMKANENISMKTNMKISNEKKSKMAANV